MSILFKKPKISEIDRDNKREQGKAKLTSQRNASPDTNAEDIDERGRIKSPTESARDQLIQPVRETFERLVNDANITIDAAIELQKVNLGYVNLSLIGAPQYVIDSANKLTNNTDKYNNIDSSLDINDWLCISNTAGLMGEEPPVDTLDEYATDADEAKALSEQIAEQAAAGQGGMTGIEMLLFMARFVVAYAVHMILGFLCCYFKGKLELSVKVFGTKYTIMALGNTLSTHVSKGERRLKALLGFPCNADEPECINEEDIPKVNPMTNLFPCCACKGENVDDIDTPSFRKCLTAAVEQATGETTGDESGCKPCGEGGTEPTCRSAKSKELAKNVTDYLIDKSIAMEVEGKEGNSQSIEALGNNITNAKAVKGITIQSQKGLIQAWDDDAYEQVGDENCSIKYKGKLDALNKKLSDVTQKDITDLALNHLELDVNGYVDKANKDIGTKNIDLAKDSAALGVIKEVVDKLDSSLTSILSSIQQFVSVGKALVNFAVSKQMCCIIYGISFLGNLITMKKLCPDESMSTYFKYSKDFAENEDMQRSLAWLKFLKQVLEALTAELAGDIKITGMGLPMGTLIEILKKVLSSTAVVGISAAAAPMDKLIRQLKGSPEMQKLLENNCANLPGLFDLFQCGINWIIDNVKGWLDGLFDVNAKNIALISNINIKNTQFGFLKALLKIINMLINMFAKMGDCYTSDEVIKEMVKNADAVSAEMYSNTLTVMKKVDVKTDSWDKSSKDMRLASNTFTNIQDADVDAFDGLTFGIDPSVVGAFSTFLNDLQLANDLELSKLSDIGVMEEDGSINITSDDLNRLLGEDARQEIIDQMLDFVQTLTNLPES